MDESTRETIGVYDANAASYVAETAGVEFGELQREFARRLPKGGRVLDLGCGSGRDSLAFLKAGFEVDAVDGSIQMVEAASGLTGLPVAHATFSDYEPKGPYDGIWACSSLLHVPVVKLAGVISNTHAPSRPAAPSTSASSWAPTTACAAGAGSPTSTSPPCVPLSPKFPGSGSTSSTSRATPAPAAPTRSGSTPGAWGG